MRFFSELSNKIIWAIASVLLIAFGYLAILNIWLKPKPIPATSNPPSNPSSSSQTQPINNNKTIVAKTTKKNQISQDNLMPALARASEVEVIRTEKLKKGAIIKVHNGFRPLRTTPEKLLNVSELKFIDVDKTQELYGFFSVPADGYYHFKIFGTTSRCCENKYNTLLIRINGSLIPFDPKQPVYLEKGWQQFNLTFKSYSNHVSLSDIIEFENFEVKWRKSADKSFSPLEIWRTSNSTSS